MSTFLYNIANALRYSVATPQIAIATGSGMIVTFLVLILSTFPRYAYQLFVAGPEYWDYMVISLIELTVVEAGYLGIGLILTYAFVTGSLFVILYGQIRNSKPQGVQAVFGVAPGIFAAGCAGCGAGVLGLIGITGALASLPFHGNGIRALGIFLVLYALGKLGDPRYCKIP